MTSTTEQRILIVSFHDLAPCSLQECQTLLSDMESIGIENLSLLLVPKWHDGASSHTDPDLCSWLSDLSQKQAQHPTHEIALHGFTHQANKIHGGLLNQLIGRFYTNSEGEFYQLSYQDALTRIADGTKIFQAMNLLVEGFTPPAWLLSDDGRQVLIDSGIQYTTFLNHIELLQENRRIHAPTLVFSSRSAWRRWVSMIWVRLWYWINRNQPVLRLAVHPIDLHYPMIRKTILALATRAVRSRIPMTYLDCVKMLSGEK